MFGPKCPIYNSANACSTNDCLFLRNGGCAIVLAATMAEENQKKIMHVENALAQLNNNLNTINQNIGKVFEVIAKKRF